MLSSQSVLALEGAPACFDTEIKTNSYFPHFNCFVLIVCYGFHQRLDAFKSINIQLLKAFKERGRERAIKL